MSPLTEPAETAVLLPPDNTLSIVVLIVAVCLLVALITVLALVLSRRYRDCTTNLRMRKEEVLIRAEFYKAAAKIARESIRHCYRGNKRRSRTKFF